MASEVDFKPGKAPNLILVGQCDDHFLRHLDPKSNFSWEVQIWSQNALKMRSEGYTGQKTSKKSYFLVDFF